MSFLSFLSQKRYPGDFLRPEVILSRGYLRNCCIWWSPPLIIIKLFFLKNAINSEQLGRETYSFIEIMQPISPDYNWGNEVKQIKLLKKICHKSCILFQLLRTKTLTSGSKCIKHFFYFYHYLHYICWVDVIYLTCHIFLKSP